MREPAGCPVGPKLSWLPRLLLSIAVLSVSACGAELGQVPTPPPPEAVRSLLSTRSLMVPVQGIAPEQVLDSFNAPRAGGREHQASDIFALRGTPVLSADDGTIVRVGQNRLGGNIIYATDPTEHLVYYYAHLDRFADHLAKGQRVVRGEVLGYVGTTGNAPPDTPHLHFQLMSRPLDGSYYGGQPIDARPYFALPGQTSGTPSFVLGSATPDSSSRFR